MTPEHKCHPDGDHMEEYALGIASKEEAALLEEHLLTCEECRGRLTGTDVFVRSMRRASAQLRSAPRREWRPWMLPRFAPVLAAALAVLLFAIGWRVIREPAAAPVAVTLIATRGAAAMQAPAGRPLLLQPDLEGLSVLPEYRVEIVDAIGRVMSQTVLRGSAPQPVTAPAARAGLYFVRVYGPDGSLLREYGLEVVPRR